MLSRVKQKIVSGYNQTSSFLSLPTTIKNKTNTVYQYVDGNGANSRNIGIVDIATVGILKIINAINDFLVATRNLKNDENKRSITAIKVIAFPFALVSSLLNGLLNGFVRPAVASLVSYAVLPGTLVVDATQRSYHWITGKIKGNAAPAPAVPGSDANLAAALGGAGVVGAAPAVAPEAQKRGYFSWLRSTSPAPTTVVNSNDANNEVVAGPSPAK